MTRTPTPVRRVGTNSTHAIRYGDGHLTAPARPLVYEGVAG
ncbi:hypothetical protein NJ7G_1423 [Natrinema sp. J7-2]|nr:hypothetical protein NJ7G_1423 [Natrinema sp. J7-2]